jgi:hypothetical protein
LRKGIGYDSYASCSKCYAVKVFADGKSGSTNVGNAVRYGYAGKAGAVNKSVLPNDVNYTGSGKDYACKAAALKSALSNLSNAVGYGNTGKS